VENALDRVVEIAADRLVAGWRWLQGHAFGAWIAGIMPGGKG